MSEAMDYLIELRECREELEARDLEITELRERAEKAEAARDEYSFTFELANRRTKEATGQYNVSPDLGVLLNRIDELEANLAMAEYDTSLQVTTKRDTQEEI